MKFCQETVSDLKKYYQGSFVKFPEAGEMLHMVEDVRFDRLRGKRWAQNDEGVFEEQAFEFLLHPDDKDTPCIEYVMPVKSYFNYEGAAYLLARNPARQYRRGITAENTHILQLQYNGSFESYNPQFAFLEAYVQKKHFEGFHAIDYGSYAVAPRIAVSANGHIMVDRTKIGTINYDRKAITLGSPLFIVELEEAVRATNSPFTVEVTAPPKKRGARRVAIRDEDGNLIGFKNEE